MFCIGPMQSIKQYIILISLPYHKIPHYKGRLINRVFYKGFHWIIKHVTQSLCELSNTLYFAEFSFDLSH